MYTVFTQEEIEQRLSKRFYQKVMVDIKDGSDTIMVKFEDNPLESHSVEYVVRTMNADDSSVGLVENGVLLSFPSKDEMDEYKRKR